MALLRTGPSEGLGRRRRAVGLGLVAVLGSVGLVSCGDDPARNADGEIVITCGNCQASPTDPGLQYNFEAAQRFNKKYDGKYQIKVLQSQNAGSGGDRLQYYQRLALADDLPDLFVVNPSELATLQETGKLMDFSEVLAADDEWSSSFYEGALDALRGDDGEVWAIANHRDAIGIYYNKSLLQAAGIDEFPETWDEFLDTCAVLKSQGTLCFAMDGNWVTLLMWANLIGTQEGGVEFLGGGISEGDYAGNPILIKATEFLRDLHTRGYVNSDAFSGEFTSASTPYVREEAAMIANGPWYITSEMKASDAARGLYENTGYVPSPGWSPDGRGVIVLAGEGAWASGAQDPEPQEAVVAWVKFLATKEEAARKTEATNTYPPVKIEFTEQEKEDFEPLYAALSEQVPDAAFTYPHVPFNAPAGFDAVWMNLWPAYVQGEMSTDEFLTRLGEDLAAPTE